MIINPDNSRLFYLIERRPILQTLTIDNQTIKSATSVELLGIYLDDKLNFNQKQSPRGVLKKRFSENMQQIYR